MVYPAGNLEGKALFLALQERSKRSLYDDGFLEMLIKYRRMYPEWEHFDVFYAQYAAHHGNYKVALEHALKAHKKRKGNYEIWKLLIRCYLALGQPERAVPFQAYCCKFYTGKLELTMPLPRLVQCLGDLSVCMGKANYAPLCSQKMVLVEDSLQARETTWGGEFIPRSMDREGYSYWAGVYNEQGIRNGHATLLIRENRCPGFYQAGAVDFVFDIMRSTVQKELVVRPQGSTVILPVAAMNQKQDVEFCSEHVMGDMCLGQWEYSYFRIEEETRVSSATEAPLVFGRPIRLGHSKKRRRFVLHILLDALNWNALRKQEFQYMPHMMDFFQKGVIFDQHFSVGEYTYPSLPTIETGMYPHHSQIFNEKHAVQLDEEYVTLSERMKELGYYCVNVMGGGDAIYNGATRGYDRLVVNSYDRPSCTGIERTIRQLESFSECDQFLFLHITEVHTWTLANFPIGLETQVKLSLPDALVREREETASVYLSKLVAYQKSNQQAMLRVDRNLKKLFDYITSHYDEDEYVIQLYSDHGSPFYEADTFLLGNGQTNAAYMARGAGVPSKGLVGELTSAVDIYPVLAKLAGFPVGKYVDGNLPAVFGGRERECVFSESMFPGHPYELCIRTKAQELQLKSAEVMNEDGTVDLSGAEFSVYMRDGDRRIVEEPSVVHYFLGLVEKFTSSFHHGGRQWASLLEARPEWYGRNIARG